MIIAHNLVAVNTQNQLRRNEKKSSDAMNKLASGLRINQAADDAAGLAISEKMRAQIRGLSQAARNVQDGISLIQTAEGGLGSIHEAIQRIRELAVQAGNDTLTTNDRQVVQLEASHLCGLIDSVADNTEFNGMKILNGDIGKSAQITTLTGSEIEIFNFVLNYDDGDRFGLSFTNMHFLEFEMYETAPAGVWTADVALGSDTHQTLLNLKNALDGIRDATWPGFGTQYNADSVFLAQHTQMYVEENRAIFVHDLPFFDSASSSSGHLGLVNSMSGSPTIYTLREVTTNPGLKLQVGANSGQNFEISIDDVHTDQLGLQNLDLSSLTNVQTALSNLDSALSVVSAIRGKMGAYQNALEHIFSNVANAENNLTAAESRIRDVDMAKEIMEFTKNNILQQAAQAMLAQANQQPQGILNMLK